MDKIIHYFWFGRKEKPNIIKKCIASWEMLLPEWKLLEWNEDNFDVNAICFTKEAYEAGKYAFVADYARCKVLYEQGGVYLDADVELLKPLDDLTDTCKGFMGFEWEDSVSPGLILGVEKGNIILKELCETYEKMKFLLPDGTLNVVPIDRYTTKILVKHGLELNNEKQEIQGITIFPREYFAPYNFYTEQTVITENTYTIHHYTASWKKPSARFFDAFRKRCKLLLGERMTERIIRWKKKRRK